MKIIVVVGIVVLFQTGYSHSCQTPGIAVEEKSDHSDHSDHTRKFATRSKFWCHNHFLNNS